MGNLIRECFFEKCLMRNVIREYFFEGESRGNAFRRYFFEGGGKVVYFLNGLIAEQFTNNEN